MVSIEEQIRQRETLLGRQEQELRSAFIPGTVKSQLELGSAQALRKARLQLQEKKKVGLLSIFQQQQSLEESKTQVSAFRQAEQKEKDRQRFIRNVQKRISRGRGFGPDFANLSKSDQDAIFKSVRDSERALIQATIKSAESEIGQTLSPEARAELIKKGTVEIPGISLLTPLSFAQPSDLTPPQLQSLAIKSDLAPSQDGFLKTTRKEVGSLLQFAFVQPFRSGSEVLKEGGGFVREVDVGDSKIASFGTQTLGKTLEVGGGFVGGFTKELEEKPIQTIATLGIGGAVGSGIKFGGFALTKFAPKLVPLAEKGIAVGGLGLGGLFVGGAGLELAFTPKGQRAEKLGRLSVEVGAFVTGTRLGSKATTKVIDFSRTFRLTEVPTGDIIAPEFLRGQTFPEIKKGSTAGELRQEFFEPIGVLGETGSQARGFTSLPVEPLTIIPKGSSFVFGGFSAPRTSPRFLRVGGGERVQLFSTEGFLEGATPTLVRTTFQDVGFAPGVTARTPKPSGRVSPEQLKFFGGGIKESTDKLLVDFGQPTAPRGQAFIPFVKAEKEAVTPFGTLTKQVGREFFFRFEGRRIPISQRETIADVGKVSPQDLGDVKSLGEVLGSSRIPRSSLVSPVEFLGFSSLPSSRGAFQLSSGFPSPVSIRSSLGSSQLSFGGLSSSSSSFGSGVPSIPISRPSRSPSRPRPTTPSPVSLSGVPRRVSQRPTKKTLPKRRSDRKKRVRKPIPKRKRKKIPVKPSFTASILDLQAFDPIKISPRFGISPFTIRRKLVRRPKKKR